MSDYEIPTNDAFIKVSPRREPSKFCVATWPRESLHPDGRKRGLPWDGKLWPPPDRRLTTRTWWCWEGCVEEANEFRRRRVYGPYCSALDIGVRCKCGAQAQGHDPGDEQA